jgi:hypothetical protein
MERITERLRPRRSRLKTLLAATSLAITLASCAANTDEGLATPTCLNGESTFELHPGQKFLLGDYSSHDSALRGPRNDWFEVRNHQGAISYKQDEMDDGKVIPTDIGFDYTENGRVYRVNYQNSDHDITAPIMVTVETICKPEN